MSKDLKIRSKSSDLFSEFFDEIFVYPFTTSMTFPYTAYFDPVQYPRHNLKQDEDKYILQVNLAGWKKQNITLKFNQYDNSLIISGQKVVNEQYEKYIVKQFINNKFQRIIPFEKQVYGSLISAEMKDGILIITLPINKDLEQIEFVKKIQIK